jgi:flagellar basal body-associated protein FliL
LSVYFYEQMNVFSRIFRFYYEGFREMTVGKTLWIIIIIKLAIMFLVLKMFFFPNFLKSNFATDEERANYVIEELTRDVTGK